jgi:hypothetical protein
LSTFGAGALSLQELGKVENTLQVEVERLSIRLLKS